MKKTFIILLAALCACTQNQKIITDNPLPDWALGGFIRPADVNPIISPEPESVFPCPMTDTLLAWESNDTFNPAATVYDGKIVVLYRAEDNSGQGIGSRTSRIGYALSEDGISFTREKAPVMYPDKDSQKEMEWTGGCEDPRVVMTEDGTYVMMYTQWNRKVPRLAVATSRDLKTWTKHGPAFEDAHEGRFFDEPTKSASILTELKDGRLVVKQIDGRYFMYWGEKHVYAAVSDNLTDWTPLVEEDGSLRKLISPREGYFDSQLTECGPPAVWTDKGIVLMYNGKNCPEKGDKRYTPNVYAAGQVLFDHKDPTKVLARLDNPFFRPMDSFEKSGQYIDGTVFIEGLVFHQDKWFLYYGCADSKVAVAVYDTNNKGYGDHLP